MLGSSKSTVTLSAPVGTLWRQVATFAPGAALPANAEALNNPAILDALYGPGKYTAENSLTGYLCAQVNNKGTPVKYVTVYTDGTIVDTLTRYTSGAASMAQAMAQMGTHSAAASAHPADASQTAPAVRLATPIA